jgi:hypothetical protein
MRKQGDANFFPGTPAKAGGQFFCLWIPACAGMLFVFSMPLHFNALKSKEPLRGK